MPYPEKNQSLRGYQKYKLMWIFEISQQSDKKTHLGIIKKHVDSKCIMMPVVDFAVQADKLLLRLGM